VYRTCLFCNSHLGTNAVMAGFAVGQRLAFDTSRGRLWVVCPRCGRWNLTPLEERWEVVEECERLFRSTLLRVSTSNIGLARVAPDLELVRIGQALRPEIAAWRYGRLIGRRLLWRGRSTATARLHDGLASLALPPAVLGWVRLRLRSRRVLDLTSSPEARRLVIRYRHVGSATLLRPERGQSWRLRVQHDTGVALLAGEEALRTAAKLLAVLNPWGASGEQVGIALAKLEDAGDPDGYFARVTALALRTDWGRDPDAPRDLRLGPGLLNEAERLALRISSRSFWGRGGTGSEPATALPHLPFVDRLALEMAVHEEAERRALEGEFRALEAAWRDAEEIAAIADGLLSEP
jgi:hypothetical protein